MAQINYLILNVNGLKLTFQKTGIIINDYRKVAGYIKIASCDLSIVIDIHEGSTMTYYNAVDKKPKCINDLMELLLILHDQNFIGKVFSN